MKLFSQLCPSIRKRKVINNCGRYYQHGYKKYKQYQQGVSDSTPRYVSSSRVMAEHSYLASQLKNYSTKQENNSAKFVIRQSIEKGATTRLVWCLVGRNVVNKIVECETEGFQTVLVSNSISYLTF